MNCNAYVTLPGHNLGERVRKLFLLVASQAVYQEPHQPPKKSSGEAHAATEVSVQEPGCVDCSVHGAMLL